MKARLLFPILGLMILVSACSENAQVNDPITVAPTNGSATTLAKLNLSMDEAAFVDEMYYLQEDLSVLLTPTNFSVINTLDGPGDRRGRGALDMAAIVFYNLIVKANATDQAGLEAIRNLIATSNQNRAKIIADGLAAGKTREEIAAELKAEHDALMLQINEILGTEGLAAIEAYKLRLQEEREKLRQAMLELRVDREVAIMKDKLGLTDEEAARVKAAMLAHHAAVAAARQQYAGDAEGFRAELARLLEEFEATMTGILGDKWQQWKDLRSGRTGEVRDPIAEQVKMLTQLLNLNEEQAGEIGKILKDQQEKIKALVQQYGSDRRGLAEALRTLQMDTDKLIQSKLTPEQLEIYLKWRRGGIRPGMGGGRG